MTKDEALKLALKALVFNQANWQGKDKAITAIKEALAQSEEKLITIVDIEKIIKFKERNK